MKLTWIHRLLFTSLCILSCLHPAQAQNKTVRGRVVSGDPALPVAGAVIAVPGLHQQTSSDDEGWFFLELPADTASLTITHAGYITLDTVLQAAAGAHWTIHLQSGRQLEGVEITAERDERLSTRMGHIRLSAEQLRSLPRFLGEPDMMKALQTLPGVQQGSEGSSALLVRGGSPDQNLVLLDGAPIYNPSHILGFFSAFNTYAIRDVELYKGAFPARFGGRLSSVVDIRLKEGNREKLKGNFSLGLLSSQLTLEGPLQKGKTTFLLSGRRTYHDLYAAPLARIVEPSVKRLQLYFYDVHAKLVHYFSDNNRLSLSAYASGDNFRLKTHTGDDAGASSASDYAIRWSNRVAALDWNHKYSAVLQSDVVLSATTYRFRTKINDEDRYQSGRSAYDLDLNSGITDYAARFNLDYNPNTRHSIKSGVSYTYHTFRPGSSFMKETNSSGVVSSSDIDSRINASEADAYAEDDWTITRKLKANTGVHASGFYVRGKWYGSLQPRVSLRYILPGSWVAKASYSRMTQYLHLLSSNSLSLPTDLWVPATQHIKPVQAQQLALGLSRNLLQGQLELTLEGYYKAYDQVLEYKEGASFLVTNKEDNWEQKVTAGKGTAYGAELFLQKKSGRLTGWLGYTMAWANRTLQEVNGGRTFPYKYDRRHTLNIVTVYKLKPGLELSGAFVYQSAAPFTVPTTQYEQVIRNEGMLSFGPINYLPGRNNIRIQATHRLDLALHFIKEKKSGRIRTWTISVYNVYNRKNLFYYQVGDFSSDRIHISGYSLMPVLPSVSWNLQF